MCWYMRQHGVLDLAFGAAFQALAAMNISNDHFSAATIHSTFNINVQGVAQGTPISLNERFRGKLVGFLDEYYCIDIQLLGLCHEQLQRANSTNDATIYGGMSFVLTGDVSQLILKQPVYRNISRQTYSATDNRGYRENVGSLAARQARAGNTVHKSATTIVLLKKVQRQDATDGGIALKSIIDELSQGFISKASLHVLNERSLNVLMHEDFSEALLLAPRHEVLDRMAQSLAISTANSQGKQIFLWNALDRQRNGQPLTELQKDILLKETNYHNTRTDAQYAKGSHSELVYYTGAVYKFTGNRGKTVGITNNNQCIAQSILLHPKEPPIPPTQRIVKLRYMPLALIVRPEFASNKLNVEGFGEGNVPVFQGTSTFVIKEEAGSKATTIIYRTGFPQLRMPGIMTDFGVQGRTIRKVDKPNKAIIDLRIPLSGTLKRASPLVLLSRFESLEQIALACPIWESAYTEQLYFEKINKIVKNNIDLVKEKKRQQFFAAETKVRYASVWTTSLRFSCE